MQQQQIDELLEYISVHIVLVAYLNPFLCTLLCMLMRLGG